MTDDSTDRPLNRLALIGLLVLTVAMRTAVIMVIPAGLHRDTDDYRKFAETLAVTGVFGFTIPATGDASRAIPSAHRAPLYPLVLSIFVRRESVSAESIAVLHVILGVGTVWLTCLVARRWGLGSWWWVPGLLVACDPILGYQSAQIMSETLATCLSVLSLFLLTGIGGIRPLRSAACAGGCLALAALCRPVFLAWLGLVAVSMLLTHAMAMRERMARCLTLVITAAAVLSPWVARNTRQLGSPVMMTTHGGYTLLLGNNPDYYRYLKSGNRLPWDSRVFERHWTDSTVAYHDQPVSLDRLAYRRAWKNIAAEPRMFLFSSAVRVARFWGIMPSATGADGLQRGRVVRYGIAAWYAVQGGLVGLGIIGLRWRCCRAPWLWGTTLCAAFTLVHAVYWSDMRMRAPLVPVLGLLASWGAAELARRLRSHNVLSAGDLPQ